MEAVAAFGGVSIENYSSLLEVAPGAIDNSFHDAFGSEERDVFVNPIRLNRWRHWIEMVSCFGLGPTLEESKRVLITATPSNVTGAGPRSRGCEGRDSAELTNKKRRKVAARRSTLLIYRRFRLAKAGVLRFDRPPGQEGSRYKIPRVR